MLDCTLITMPQVVQIGKGTTTKFAPVSPFVSTAAIGITGASVSLPPAQFVPSAVHPDDPEYNEFAFGVEQ
ncbi:hypothetical protein LP420_01205 [Massilia sp. B-10]|nr:hypothetical protein LP420_01205 [Massilia sp. B-10]